MTSSAATFHRDSSRGPRNNLPCRGASMLLAVALAHIAAAAQLTSPDGNLAVNFTLSGDAPVYNVAYKGTKILLNSGLGLDLYSGGFELAGQTSTKSRSQWVPVYGERNLIPDNYNQLTIELRPKAPPRRPLQLTFRAYDEGIAFRYTVLGAGRFTIEEERTEFHFPPGAEAYEEHGTEGPYQRVPIAEIKPECERPLTVDYGNGVYASLTEAALVDYSRMLLSPVPEKPGALVSDLSGPVRGAAPFSTPWRVLIVGDRPGDLTERNYLVLNLNPPNAISDTAWIKPGKVIREVTLSTEGGKACVDFAVARGLQYIEYDAGWYGYEHDETQDATTVTPDPKRTSGIPGWAGLDLQEVIDYASERGIGVFLYVNRRHLEQQLDELLPLFQRWGVKGMKFGFVQVGEQKWTRWLHDAVRQAAEHKIMVDVHDSYRPTGFSRTYPNLLTQEGIRGNEHMPTAEHNVTLPFTRFIAGAGDSTICYYTRRIKTTRAHQLALAVVVYSPLQFLFWYDRPSAYQGEPEIEFFKHVPTVWDDTRVIDGSIGEYIITARRRGEQWYVGILTNGDARALRIPLTFLDPGRKYRAFVYRDGPTPTSVLIETETVDSSTTLAATLAPSGGQAVRLTPIRAR